MKTMKVSPEYLVVSCEPFHHSTSTEERRAVSRERRAALKEAGFKMEYRYRLTQRGLANAMKAKIEKKTGVPMKVSQVFDLMF